MAEPPNRDQPWGSAEPAIILVPMKGRLFAVTEEQHDSGALLPSAIDEITSPEWLTRRVGPYDGPAVLTDDPEFFNSEARDDDET